MVSAQHFATRQPAFMCKPRAMLDVHQDAYAIDGFDLGLHDANLELPSIDVHADLNEDRRLARQRSGSILPEGALQRMEDRALRESWTAEDIHAATLQALLLTYESTTDACDKYGFRYVESASEDYVHNCPWNDWNPPSKARLPTPTHDAVQDRVRVIVCTSLDRVPSDFVFRARRHEDAAHKNFIIAFASVERSSDGSRVLCLRRGNDILATIPLHTVCCKFGERSVQLSPEARERSVKTPKVCLKFESDGRLSKFRAMMLADCCA